MAISLVRGIERIARAIGRPELLDDERLQSNEGRQQNSGELEALISAWTSERTRKEAFAQLQAFEVICAPVNTMADLASDAQFLHRRSFQQVKLADVSLTLPGRPFREAGQEPEELLPPRFVDRHGREALGRPHRTESRSSTWQFTPRPPLDQSGAAPHAAARPLPLSGVRVIDFGDAWAGPYACTLLADAGAEVIRIEDIHRMPANMRGRREPGARAQGYVNREPGHRPWDRFYLYNGCERNKYGITLDLKQEKGRELFLDLVRHSDVVVSNYAHGALASLHLEYHDLKRVNPGVIMLYISGYGSDGPYSNYVALGPTVDAASGHQSLRGYPETAPADSAHTYYPDVVGSYTSFFAVVAALHRKSETGEGRSLELALTEALLPHFGAYIGEYSLAGKLRPLEGNRDRQACPHGCYPTRDLDPAEDGRLRSDRWIAIACWDEGQWQALASLMGRPDLASDHRFASAPARKSREDELDAYISDWSRHQDGSLMMHALQAAGVPAASVMADSELFEDPHVLERGFLREVRHREAGSFLGPGPVWQSAKHELGVRMPANCLGEHNRLVLRGLLGVSDVEFAQLEADEVCGEVYALRLAQEGQ
jgi:crotonobetainyl-CoA:carnitine CoA-transferase CaiB-like acyl-CoA transferase